jgi:very-short-patch-repair endonuclease
MVNSLEELHRVKELASSHNKHKNKYMFMFRKFLWDTISEMGIHCKVRTEYVVYPYIIDLFLVQLGIGIELDGKEHEKKIEYDSKRDSLFENLGILMLHFDYDNIDNYFSEVKTIITNAILSRKDKVFNHSTIRINNSIYSPPKSKVYLTYDETLRKDKLAKRKELRRSRKQVEESKRQRKNLALWNS